jgi:hypothetical protein
MTVDTLESRAHELLAQLNPGKLAAVVQLLEVMVDGGEQDPITQADHDRIALGEAWFGERGQGVPMEDVLADFGLTLDDFTHAK